MADQVSQESCPVPEATVVDPRPAMARNGQCAADGFSSHPQQLAKTPTEPEMFTGNQEMKMTDTVDGEGNFRAGFGFDTCFKSCLRVWLGCSL